MVKRGRYLLKSKREHAKEKPNIEQIKAILDHSLYGVPVEEVDPFVFDETFCVICKKYGTHYVYRFSASRSLFIFGPFNPIRKFACRIISNQFFDFLIILVILCNCVTLAMLTNYEDTKTGKIKVNQKLNEVIEYVEYLFLFMYSLEMALKIVARGFAFNKFSYIRNSWNILDFAVVTASAISIILMNLPSGSPTIDLELFRSLRVLRVIKTISIVPGLRLMINALVSSVVQLLEVMALTLFCLMLFSLLALELFMGKLRQKCVLVKNGVRHLQMIYEERSRSEDELGSIDPNDPDRNLFFYEWANNRENWLIRKDDYPKEEYQPCGNDTWSRRCPPGYECLDNIGDNYDDGWTSFDNFFNSMLTTFQLITLDFWERIYDLVLSPTSPWSVIFFLLVIFLGSFYLLNLMLAVVAMSYDREYHKSAQVALPTAQKLSLKRKASTFSFQDPASLNIIAMTHMPRRTPSEREMIIRTIKKSSSSNGSFIQEYVLGGESRKQKHKLHHTILTLLGRRRSGETENDEDTGTAPESRSGSIFSKGPKPSAVSTSIDASRKESKKFTEDIVEVPTNDITAKKLTSTTELEPVPSDISAIEKKEEKSGGSGCWFLLCLENMFTSIANHEAFEMAITTIIILNTFFLACEHHNQPEWLNSVLKLGNH
ncbi:unnamed protein product [Allacma fusca]|nr:unnamed protein product [Allacma fusca]